MMLVHASFIFMNAAAGGRQSCLSGVNTCPDITYYAAVSAVISCRVIIFAA